MNTDQKIVQEGDGYQDLKEKSSIGEILEAASSFEYNAFTFYTSLLEQVDESLRSLVRELAAEEQSHYELFQGLSKHPYVQEHIAKLVNIPPSDNRFSDYMKTPALSEFSDDKAILQYAIGREQAAMEQYSSLAKEALPGPVQDLFCYLAYEELQHKEELEKRYLELSQDNDA